MADGQGEPCLGESSNMRQPPAGGTGEERCAHDLETGKRPEIYEAGGRKKAGVVDTRDPITRLRQLTWADVSSRIWKPQGLRDVEIWRDVFVEYLGTMLFVFFAIGAIVFTDFKFSGAVGLLAIAFAFGLSIFAVVYSSAGISGGHINPAVTLGMFIAGRIDIIKGTLYILAQMVGAICGAGMIHAINTTLYDKTNGGCNFVQPGYSNGAALGAEIAGTFILVYTVMAATDPLRSCIEGSPHLGALAPFAIGTAVFVVHVAIIPVDGVSINPARSFGPAVVLGGNDTIWDDMWIFWVGPAIGALIATLVYEWIIRGADFRSMQRKLQ